MIIRYAIIDDKNKRYTFWHKSKEAALNAFIKDLFYRPEWGNNAKNMKFGILTTTIHKEIKYEKMNKQDKKRLIKGVKYNEKISNTNY